MQAHVVAEVDKAAPVVREQMVVADAIEVIGSEITEGHAIAQHVVHGYEQGS